MLVGSSQSPLSVSDFRNDIFGSYDDGIFLFFSFAFLSILVCATSVARCNVPDLRFAPSRFSRTGFQYLSSASHAGFQILRRRLHDYFVGLLLEEPRSQRSQLFRLAAKHPPLKLVFAFDFNVGHNYSQHLLVDIDSRYLVGHSSSWPGAESVLRLL